MNSSNLQINHDYIIIGAGIIGCSTACYLKKALPEKKILLIDRNLAAGAGNTAKSAALYRNFFTSRTNRVLAASSIKYYLELGDKIHLDPTGYLWLFSEEQWKNSQKSIRQLDMKKDEFDILDRAAISGILRIDHDAKGRFADVHAGIYCHLCGSLSAMALAQHYAKEFISLGGEVGFGIDIRSFILTGESSSYAPWDDVHVDKIMDGKGNSYRASNYIIAAGAWMHDLLAPVGIASGILPKKRQLFALDIKDHAGVFVDRTAGKKPAIILPAGGIYINSIPEKNILIVSYPSNGPDITIITGLI